MRTQERSGQRDIPAGDDAATLTISPEKVCLIIINAKEADAKDEVTEPDLFEELTVLINSLSQDEQIDLVALAWLGHNNYVASDWPAVRKKAAAAHNERRADYLIGMPLLGDFLEEGLSMLGYSCEEFEVA